MSFLFPSNYIFYSVSTNCPMSYKKLKIFNFRKNDLDWPQMKFETIIDFIISDIIFPDVFMTHAAMSHRKRIFKSKFNFWPQGPRDNILWRNTFCTQAYRLTKRLKEKKMGFRHFCSNYMLRKIWLYMSKIFIFWTFLEFEIFFSI